MVNEDPQIINLNLYNFESKEASYYPYILTSPRSLKSCRLANIKPIELLHRSIQDISIDFNTSLENADQIYKDYENERSRKLKVCKLIRKHMLTMDSQNQEVVGEKSLKQYLNECQQINKSPCYSRGNTPEFPQHIKQNRLLSPVSTPASFRPRSASYSPIKKQKTKQILFREKIPSSETSSPLQPIRGVTNLRRTKSAENNKCRKIANETCMKQSSSLMPLAKEYYPCARSVSNCGHREKSSNDRELCWQIDKLKKCEENRANFPKPALKKTHFQKCDSPVPTNQQKASKAKITMQKKCIKKKNPAERNCHELLENRDRGKSKKNQSNVIREKKKKRMIENFQNGLGPVDIKNHDIRILDAMFFNREKEQLERNFARKADLIWDACGCKNFLTDRNLSSSPKIKKFVYAEKPDICTCNENRMFNLYFQQIRNKMKQLKEDSLSKELHSEQVRQLARELQTGMEQWQDQILLLQWRALQRAKINAKLQLENKRLKTQTENNERAQLHALRFRNVQEMERIKQQIVRKEVEKKYSRIERLKMKREREIMDCKAQAQYTADLRDQLRRTLTPETFDRKANDAIVKSKFITRTLTSSPLVESHIRLG